MTDVERFTIIARGILSIVPEDERPEFRDWLVKGRYMEYVQAAELISGLLVRYTNQRMDIYAMDEGL